MSASDPKPPVAARKPVTATLHGIARTDDYAWLKDAGWQRVMREPETLDPDIRAYLEAENAYTDAFFAPHTALRETLVREMRGRMKEDDSSVPAPDGDWAYYRRYVEGGEHPLYCRAPRATTKLPRYCCSTATAKLRAKPISGSATASTAATTAASPTPSTSTARSVTASSSATSPPAR